MNPETKGGFAHLSRDWLVVWQYLADDERAVLPLLMSYLPNIFPKIETLAARLNKRPRAVRRTLLRMSQDGIVLIESRRGGRGNTNRITLANVDLPQIVAAIVGRRKGVVDDPLSEKGVADDTLSPTVKGVVEDPKRVSSMAEKGVVDDPRSNTREGLQEKEESGADAPAGRSAPGLPPASLCSGGAGELPAPASPTAPDDSEDLSEWPPICEAEFDADGDADEPGADDYPTPALEVKPTPPAPARADETAHESMVRFLLFGKRGQKEPNREDLPPSTLNWRQFRASDFDPKAPLTPDSLGIERWGPPHFAGYFWFQVSYWRGQRKVPQTNPQVGKVVGHMKNLLSQLGSKWRLFRYLGTITADFDLCCAMVGGKMVENMIPDETTPQQPQMKSAAIQLMDLGDQARSQLYQQHGAAIVARRAKYGLA